MRLTILLSTLLLFAACANENTEQGTTSALEEAPTDKARNYRGSIGKTISALEVQLIIEDSRVVGSYIDRKNEAIVPLKGVLREGKDLELASYDETGTVTAVFIGNFSEKSIKGEWFDKTSENQTPVPFELYAEETKVSDAFLEKIKGTYEYSIENYGSYIVIEPTSRNTVKYQILIVSGSCTGELTGEAYIFDEQHINAYGEDNCFLNLFFDKNIILATEISCFYHHGFGCAFDGTYRKVSNTAKWIQDS